MLNIMKKWIFLQQKQPAVFRDKPDIFLQPEEHPVMADTGESQHHHGEILCRHLLDGMAVIEIIRNSLLDSGTRLAGEQGTLDEIAMHNCETRRYMQELCGVLDDINEHADKGLDYTQKLVFVLEQINQNINNIERLSNQTNLLAVNSAIEASHVGRRGAGFSVIAREIKQLSCEIQDEAINITAFTGKIKSHAKAIYTDAEDNQKLVISIRDIAVQAEDRLQNMITSSSRMEAIIRFVAVQQFLNTVKLDHVIWKGDIYRRLLDGNTDLSVNDHTQCRLGKWYYADEGQRFIGHNAYRKLEKPHQLVHLSGRLALAARAQGSFHDADLHLTAMEDASREVIENIDDLLASISY